MEIKYYDITQIKGADYNPRIITDKELEGLRKSLRRFGFVEPLVYNTRTNTLVGGHQRLRAAELEGMTKVPVCEVDLSDHQEKALNITLNSHAVQGKWDIEVLSGLIDDIKFSEKDLALDLNIDQLEKDLGLYFNSQAGTYTEEAERMPNQAERLENHENNPIKQMFLMYEIEDYTTVVNALDEIVASSENIDNYSDAVLYLCQN